MHDFVIVGGGIVGLSTAMQLARAAPGAGILLVEKEADLAAHQTGRNSGVIHAGVYYEPGSLKAQYCKAGSQDIMALCRNHGVPFEQCGKLIVATNADELARMESLHQRALKNELEVERIDSAELARREPNISGLAALYFPATGITDYAAVSRVMAAEFKRSGGEIRFMTRVTDVRENSNSVTIELSDGAIKARYLIGCAGLFSDRLARMSGIDLDFAIVPFRGEYFRLAPVHDDIVRHLIYPVPDPTLPFLGVHLTRMIGGFVTVGPNAVLSLKREGYTATAFNVKDFGSIVGHGGFWRFLRKNLESGVNEMRNSLSKRRYLRLCQKYCPKLKLDDLLFHRSGVRAQAVFNDGRLAHDFLIKRSARTIHVCNAPSPAATASIPIGRHILGEITKSFGLSAHPKPMSSDNRLTKQAAVDNWS